MMVNLSPVAGAVSSSLRGFRARARESWVGHHVAPKLAFQRCIELLRTRRYVPGDQSSLIRKVMLRRIEPLTSRGVVRPFGT